MWPHDPEDAWKYATEKGSKSANLAVRRTRAQEQARIDDLYMKGKMSRDLWSRLTDNLSELTLWKADGVVMANCDRKMDS